MRRFTVTLGILLALLAALLDFSIPKGAVQASDYPPYAPATNAQWTTIAPHVWYYQEGDFANFTWYKKKWYVSHKDGFQWMLDNVIADELGRAAKYAANSATPAELAELAFYARESELLEEIIQTGGMLGDPFAPNYNGPSECNYAKASTRIADQMEGSAEACARSSEPHTTARVGFRSGPPGRGDTQWEDVEQRGNEWAYVGATRAVQPGNECRVVASSFAEWNNGCPCWWGNTDQAYEDSWDSDCQ